LARWQYHKRWLEPKDLKLPANRGDVEEALRLAPDDADVLLAAAELGQLDQDTAGARAGLEKGRKRYPQDARFYGELARLERGQAARDGDATGRGKALQVLREGGQKITGDGRTDVLWTLCNVLLDGTNGVATGAEIEEARLVIAQITKANGSP